MDARRPDLDLAFRNKSCTIERDDVENSVRRKMILYVPAIYWIISTTISLIRCNLVKFYCNSANMIIKYYFRSKDSRKHLGSFGSLNPHYWFWGTRKAFSTFLGGKPLVISKWKVIFDEGMLESQLMQNWKKILKGLPFVPSKTQRVSFSSFKGALFLGTKDRTKKE